MFKTSLNSPSSTKSSPKVHRKDPISDLGKHIRSRKVFKAETQSKQIHSLRLCASYSPQAFLAENYLKSLNSLCEDTKQKVGFTRKNVVSLTMKLGKMQPVFDEFQERREDLLGQCQEFVNDRKFKLRTQQEMLFTKKLQRTVTKKMLGE
jgi:Mg2+ and Co2+ transporter CorA